MADQTRRRISRVQLAQVFKSHELIVAFEKIIASTEETPETIAQVKLIADQALELANALVLGVLGRSQQQAGMPLSGESSQLVDAVRAFLPRPQQIPDVQAGTGVTITRNAQGWVINALSADDAQFLLRRPPPQRAPDVLPGTATTVTRNAQGFVVNAAPDDAQHILANRVFGH